MRYSYKVEQVETVEKIAKASDAVAAAQWGERSSARMDPWPSKTPSVSNLVLDLGRSSWAWLHLLSLDAPLVAVLWQLLFTKALRVHLPPVVTLVTALAIWLIYVADRILDSYQEGETPKRRYGTNFIERIGSLSWPHSSPFSW